jgi:uroporphyrinogen-III synthase
VILTRPEGRNEQLAARLRSFPSKLRVVIAPLIATEPIETAPVVLTGYDWLILTSATGAHELERRAAGQPRRVAAIGKATADAWNAGVDLVPAVSTQEGLLAEIPRPAGRVLFAGAENARRLLVEELDADFVALYRTRAIAPTEPLHGDLVVLASPSAASSFAALGLSIPAVTIGPETTRAAEGLGVRVVEEAATYDTDGLVSAVLRASR